jgi:cytochrome b subunit of formate dehydrogenase
MVVHFFAARMVVSGLMIHVTCLPRRATRFLLNITGKVNELYAHHHHFKWWREVRLHQRAWEQQLAEQEGGNDDAADVTVQNRTVNQTSA